MWRKQRITLAPMFTNNNFKRLMRDTFITKADRLVELLGKVADEGERGEGKAAAKNAEGGGGSGGMVDMQRCFFAFTMDSIQQIFFGRDTDTVRGKHDAYAAAFDEAGYDDMPWLRTLDEEHLRKLVTSEDVGMRPGHAEKFVAYLLRGVPEPYAAADHLRGVQ